MYKYWYWTDARLATRREKLEKLMRDKKDNYIIQLTDCFIDIRNKTTMQGIYTDSLKIAKRWILKDMDEGGQKKNDGTIQ